MNRRDMLRGTATLGFAAAIPFSAVDLRPANAASTAATSADNRLPAPNALKPPAQGSIPVAFLPSEAVLTWIRQASKTTDVTMSVCTGAFVLAKTGLLSGKAATTHHGAYAELAMAFPDIRVKRGALTSAPKSTRSSSTRLLKKLRNG
jgi:transcriptional regulator GlxA family with amidase domain